MVKKILTRRQIVFLESVGKNTFLREHFYLSGGTALAAFYLEHRYSEDLDFFSEEEFDVSELNVFFQQLKKKLSIKKIDFQQTFNRNLFFLHFSGEVLKIEFTFFPFPRIEVGKKEFSCSIDSLLDIAVNKLFTIYQRTKARDYIDLYCICQEKSLTLDSLIKKAKLKFDWHIDPIQLGTQFMQAKKAEDYPRMIKKIDDRQWQNFFSEEAKKLKPKIME